MKKEIGLPALPLAVPDGTASRKHGRHAKTLLMTTALFTGAFTGAHAQSSATAINLTPPPATEPALKDIVVSARHRRENIQKVPLAISVLSGRQLEQTGTYTLAQVQHSTPNLVSYNTNSRNSSIAIRGIGVNSAADGLDTTVGVYVDGVYLGRPGMALTDLIDIDQIEVLRGPQGTLWGRNTAGGALNVTTEQPSFTPGASVEASLGNYWYAQERATVTGPINDKVAVRFTAFNTDRDGWLANSYDPDKPGNSINRLGGRADVLIQPNPDLTITLRADYAREQDSADVSVISQDVNSTTAKQELAALTQVAAADGISWRPTPSLDSAALNSPQNQRNSSYGTSATVEWRHEGYTFTSISAWRGYYFGPLQDSDGTPLDILQVNVAVTHDNQLSQEFRVASPTGGLLDWQVGAFLFHQWLGDHYILNQYGSDAATYFNDLTVIQGKKLTPANTATISTGAQYNDVVSTTADSEAIFGQGTLHATNKLDITGGARLTGDQRYGTAYSYVNGTILPASRTPVIDTDSNLRGGNLSGMLSASYKFTPDSMAYLSFADGYQSGGLNLDVSVPATEVKIKPVIIDDYEAGIKETLFNHTLIFDADAYWENIYNYQANIYPLSGAKSYLSNIKGIRARGFELETTWEPIDGLLVRANGSYNDAVYTSYHNGACPPEYTGAASACDETGRPVYYAPRWIGNLTAQYTRPINEEVSAYGLVQYSYTSGFFGSADDSRYTWQKPYETTNLRAGITLDNGKYDISMWGNNVFNTRYFTSFSESSYGFISGQLGDPASFGATVRANF